MTVFADPAGGELSYEDVHDRSYVDIMERLFRQFEDRLSLRTIVEVVRTSREHLRGSPLGAMPELTERLAIERLTTLATIEGQPAAIDHVEQAHVRWESTP
ncbi:MAG: hypothetical protein ACR2N4_18300 [Jatrophihabitans sp.]